MNLRSVFISIAIMMLLGSLIASPNTWEDAGLPIRQGVNIEWSRTAAHLKDGTVVFVWSDTRFGGRDLWAQAVDENGVLWEESLLIDDKTDRQEDPVIIETSDGNAIIAWIDFHYNTMEGDVCAQKISPDGKLLWSETKNLCLTDGIQISLNIVPDNDGGAHVIWQDHRNGFVDIYGVHIDSDGNNYEGWPVNGLPLASGNHSQHSHTFWQDGENGAILAYIDEKEGVTTIQALRVLSDGEIAWSRALASDNVENTGVRIAPMGNDAFGFAYIVKESGVRNICVKAIDKDGSDLWENEKILYRSNKEQLNPRTTIASDGGFIVAWEDNRNTYMPTTDIYVQKIGMDGEVLWEADGLPIVIDEFEQKNPRIESDGDGGCYITWEDARTGNYPIKDIYVQHVLADGTCVWEENGKAVTLVNADTSAPLLKTVGNKVFIAWADKRNGSVGIYSQAYDFNGNTVFNGVDEEFGKIVYWGLSGNAINYRTIKSGDNLFVLWSDSRYANLGFQIKVQKIDENGNIYFEQNGQSITKHSGANQSASEKERISVTQHHSGGIAVAWNEQREENVLAYVQAIDADGNMLWDELGMNVTTNVHPFLYQYTPEISQIGDSYLVAWVETDMMSDNYARDVKAQKIVNGSRVWGANGKKIAWQLFDNPDYPGGEDHQVEAVVEDYVVWTLGDGKDTRLFVKKLDEDGNAEDGWDNYGLPVCVVEGARIKGVKAIKIESGLLVAWEDKRGGDSSIYGQIIDAGGSIKWTENGLAIADYENDQSIINLDFDGEYIYVAWRDARMSASSQDIAIQKLDLQGNRLWGDVAPFVVSDAHEKDRPAMVKVGKNILVIWDNYFGAIGSDIYGQLINGNDGSRFWNNDGEVISDAEKRQLGAQVVPFDDRYVFAVWHDGRSSGKEEIVGLYAQRIDARFLSTDNNELVPLVRHQLNKNYPNPFNPETTISFSLAKNDHVSLNIYNLKGQLVKTLIGDEYLEKGHHKVVWNGTDYNGKSVGTGMYFYKMETAGTSSTQKMLLLK